jgi:GNAT superfamily N-acetyltransferase
VDVVRTSPKTSRSDHLALFRTCFPGATHFSEAYLRWLYTENPSGNVLGFDAWDGTTLAATYVCVPVTMLVDGDRRRALLSLNTATHPGYQGRGLFTKLAERTFEAAVEEGFSLVYGVANASSTPGFVRKLGFDLMEQLEASVGPSRHYCSTVANAHRDAGFRRYWDKSSLAWRVANPSNRIGCAAPRGPVSTYVARTGNPVIRVVASTLTPDGVEPSGLRWSLPGPMLFLGTLPRAHRLRRSFIRVPDRFRPSPLNLIYRSLDGRTPRIGTRESLITFLDFDAF